VLLPVPLQVSGPFLAYPSAHKSGFLDFRVHGHFSNQVNVVGLEAISDERHSIEVHVLAQQLKVNRSIGVAIEYEAPCVSTLCHMMRDIHCHHSVKSPMTETITAAIPRCPNLCQVEKTLIQCL
jgi:hypothetical protein